jgi:solute carrier family 13 (sodium-dependent dicarboxylate transporter), member 2/3/5
MKATQTLTLRIGVCLILAVLVHQTVPASGGWMGAETAGPQIGLALFAFIGGLWVTQALPLALTALLVPLLAVLSGVSDLRTALAPFAHPIIFLFLGGFALAAALQQQGLDGALALVVLRLARGRRSVAVVLLFAMSAFLSMWISNTATAALMLPLALGLLRSSGDGAPTGPAEQSFVLLGVAYSSSIGGMATLVGSPPNAIAAAQAGISFADWLVIGLPLVAVLLPLMVTVLVLVLRPDLAGRADVSVERLAWTPQRRATVAIFALTAAGWVGGAPLGRILGVFADIDSLVALAAIAALVGSNAVSWKQVERTTRWSVLLLFGGGLALGQVMDSTGASRFLAQGLVALLAGPPVWVLLVTVVVFVSSSLNLSATRPAQRCWCRSFSVWGRPSDFTPLCSPRPSPSQRRVHSCSPSPHRPMPSSLAPARYRRPR